MATPKVDDETIKREYLAAYAAANPEIPLPTIHREGGWWYVGRSNYRKTAILAMTKRLRERVALNIKMSLKPVKPKPVIAPATDEDIEYLRELMAERENATTIYPEDDQHFANWCDDVLPKLLARLTAAERRS